MLDVISRPEEMSALEDDWNRLAAPSASPFVSYTWFATCAQVCSPRDRPMVVVSRSAHGVEAIAPLAEVSTPRGPTLEIMGSATLGEPNGLLYRDEKSLGRLLDGLLTLGKPVVLRRLHSASLEAQLVSRTRKSRALVSLWSGGESPYLPIEGSWSAYEATLSPGQRTNLRRKLRRAAKSGEVEMAFITPSPAELPRLLEAAFRVEAASWKGQAGTAILEDPWQKRFFESYCDESAKAGRLHVGFMRIGGKEAAMLIAVALGRTLWTLKMGYDAAFGDCSPGALLTHESIRYAFENGFSRYEFCGWREAWQSSWTERAHRYVSTTLYPISARGLRAFGLDIPRLALRTVRNLLKAA